MRRIKLLLNERQVLMGRYKEEGTEVFITLRVLPAISGIPPSIKDRIEGLGNGLAQALVKEQVNRADISVVEV
jgi:hypothetical protein